MLFDTVAEYQAEIAEVRTYLKAGLDRKSYEYTSGGPGSGAAEGWSRDPAAALAYLKMLTDESAEDLTTTPEIHYTGSVLGDLDFEPLAARLGRDRYS